MKKRVSSWGRLTNDIHDVYNLDYESSIKHVINNSQKGIVYGNGRSYGDICLNPDGVLWDLSNLNKLIHFDEDTGILKCEAGVLIKEINEVFISKGWMLPVTAGTQLITVGGAIANDIHGKNHHFFGSFGNHVKHLDLLRSDGNIRKCCSVENSEIFYATIGGMGLTGIILSAEIQLRKVSGSFIEGENIPYSNLEEFFDISIDSEKNWEHTVSWIDCTSSRIGRGIFTRGNFVEGEAKKAQSSHTLNLAIQPPVSLINRTTLNLFNKTYYAINKYSPKNFIQNYQKFLYPLDNIMNWNRMYGPKGFYQYQSVIPKAYAKDATKEMLNEIKLSGEGSFLAVLKTFGNKKSIGMLSFPIEGVTLALDFPNRSHKTNDLFKRLDKIIEESHGKIYLAKDSRMPASLFKNTYSNYVDFIPYIDKKFSSSMSKRLMGI